MIAKALIGLSALVSAGVVVGVQPASRPAAIPAAFADRFPTFEELLPQPAARAGGAAPAAARTAARGDRLPVSRPAGCDRDSWPYLASECLVSLDGSPVRRPARTITIERRFAQGSVIVQAAIADFARR